MGTEQAGLTLDFTMAELEAMHRFCLRFRELVRRGGDPTPEQEEAFMAFQFVCYETGVAVGP